jgi:hypothetical protein
MRGLHLLGVLVAGIAGAVGLVVLTALAVLIMWWLVLSLAAEQLIGPPVLSFRFSYLAILVFGIPLGAAGGVWLMRRRLPIARWPGALAGAFAAAFPAAFLGVLVARLAFRAISYAAIGGAPIEIVGFAELDTFSVASGTFATLAFCAAFWLMTRAYRPVWLLGALLASMPLAIWALYLFVRAPRL